jgi:hypothetical protein
VTPGYLVSEREMGNIVAPKECDYEDLVCYTLITAREMLDLEPNISGETIESKNGFG